MASNEDNAELWDKEADSLLRTMITLYGAKEWERISNEMNKIEEKLYSRTPQQCKDRYHYLIFYDSKESWTDREGVRLIMAHKEYKNKWAAIATALKGRSNNSIKNRFYSIFRKIKNKILRNDYKYNSKLELLEAFYTMSLMKAYYESPAPVKERGGKRGTDFIFSLLKGLELQDVINYKAELLKHGMNEITPEELWEEMEKEKLGEKPAESKRQNLTSDIPMIKQLLNNEYRELPPLSTSRLPLALTSEEKNFIQTQFFQIKEPLSARICTFSPLLVNSTMQTPVPFSAESQPLVTKKFDSFSDFTDMRKTKGFQK